MSTAFFAALVPVASRVIHSAATREKHQNVDCRFYSRKTSSHRLLLNGVHTAGSGDSQEGLIESVIFRGTSLGIASHVVKSAIASKAISLKSISSDTFGRYRSIRKN